MLAGREERDGGLLPVSHTEPVNDIDSDASSGDRLPSYPYPPLPRVVDAAATASCAMRARVAAMSTAAVSAAASALRGSPPDSRCVIVSTSGTRSSVTPIAGRCAM